MSNTQAMCDSFKKELLLGVHAFGTGTGVPAHTAGTADTFKAALYLATATIDKTTTAYGTTGEVTGTGYTAGGVSVTFGTDPDLDGDTAHVTPSASIVYTTVTLATSFDCALIYNTAQGNKAVSVHTFGAQTITAGTLTLTMPTDDGTTGLLRIA